ncbi:MAG: hypothetical protein A2W00_12000 [Candidatus Eisenbacteria bacterium RBG_16_71_46]|nr:MAG: hypothetical protein A2W00_12000 [Candidatus Eisenbacteria bacterium RBG_16_71_46]
MEQQVAKRRSRRIVLWSVMATLALGALAGGALVARNANGNASKDKKKSDKDAPLPVPVELSAVGAGAIATFLETTTTLEARHSAVLVARRAGQVVALGVEEGQWVKKGEVLARLEDTEARLALERTQLALEMAERELERGRQLVEQNYLSKKEMDDLELKRRNTWVELEQARYDLSQTRLTAPFAGRVVDRLISLGETVPVGKECFRLIDFDPLRAPLYFPERELTRVHVGQEAGLTMDAHPGREIRARVALVNPTVDRSNGTFKVTLELPNPAGELRPGAFARVRLKTGAFTDALLMPRRGVVQEDGESFVFVARGDSVVRVPVTLGAVENDTAQILSGLSAGDSVVTVGQGGLKPGAKIRSVTL